MKGLDIISIHAPAKGATEVGLMFTADLFDFNPRSREGSDLTDTRAPFWYNISIHAPAKGATNRQKDVHNQSRISIHAPAKGATAILYNKFHFLCIILYILSAIT